MMSVQSASTVARPEEILDFWWQAGAAKWFARDDAFDQDIRSLFLPTVEAALDGQLSGWADSPHGCLALTLVLDQFTRNIFRQNARAFAGDPQALLLAERALAEGYDRCFPKEVRVFFYLPFEHAENMEAQQTSVDLCRRLGDQNFYLYALIHMDVIRRFGRFPHRNEVLGRETSLEERAYLEDGGFSA